MPVSTELQDPAGRAPGWSPPPPADAARAPAARRRAAAAPVAAPLDVPAGARPVRAPRATAATLARWGAPLAMLGFVALAGVVLHRELAGTGYAAISRAVRDLPTSRVVRAVALMFVAYVILGGYDALALRWVGTRLPARRVVLSSAVAYGISQTLGFAALTGNAVRYRFWSAWGLGAAEIAQALAFVGVTFVAGLVAVTGAALALEPAATLARLGLAEPAARALGVALLAAIAAWVAWCARRGGRAVAWRGLEFPVPGARVALAQLALAAADWLVAAAVPWALLPPTPTLGFLEFAGLFTLAQSAGLLSHVPGGLGVFDAAMVLLLGPVVGGAGPALAVVLAYRAVYYLLPFALAVATLGASEAARQRRRVATGTARLAQGTARAAGVAARTGRATALLAGRLGPAVLPTVLAAATFGAGVVLLLSGATPSVHPRIHALGRVVPLPLIELSHFAASMAGVGLLVLALAIRRRLDAAYGLTVALLVVGIVGSLLKGLDFEEALLLAGVLACVLPARHAFYRRAALTREALEPGWIVAVVAVVGASVWLGLFSFRHVDYGGELWWQFTARGDAPRFLRASAGAVLALGALGLARLLRPAGVEPAAPDAAALARAAAIAQSAPESAAALALLGDKALLFAGGAPVPAEDGFVMYAVEGRSWIAMGDPVGPPERRAELAWRFREEADRHGAWPVFYQVRAESLPLYIDLGLTFVKLGEEAIVPLTGWSLEGGTRKGLRRMLKDGEKRGLRFAIVPTDEVPALLPALRAVSDEWLTHKAAREKGFSLGRFDAAYLRHFPCAVVRDASGALVAFANVWTGDGRTECSVDLMRHRVDAPKAVMDFLFVQLLQWAAAQGYARFNLGMAPLAGLTPRHLAPLWTRAGALVARRGEAYYNFAGLRAYKEKFGPVWEPRYLASPGGLALPRILAAVAARIAGGLGGVVRK